MDQVATQRDYYARTAGQYDEMHANDALIHSVALSAFRGIVDGEPPQELLEVGAGTGTSTELLASWWPDAKVVGIEPVEALRAQGHARGIPQDMLVDGNALALDYPDDSFDFVIETAVLHHVPDPRRAVAEMVRVARRGVMLSDANRYGQGSLKSRVAKDVLRRLNLMDTFIWLQTRGKMHKWSEGDGLYYSYSVFDEMGGLTGKFPRLFLLNTVPAKGTDLRFSAEHAMLLAMK